MQRVFTKVISLVLTLALVGACMVFPASAVTYKSGANSISSSYASSKYYQNLQKVTLTGDGRTDVLAVALSQLGYCESDTSGDYSGLNAGSSNYTEYCYNMGNYGSGYGYEWCASFVAWSLLQSGCTDQNTMSAWCRNYLYTNGNYIWREVGCGYWANQLDYYGYYQDAAYYGGSYTPQSGDLIFFYTGGGINHIGIVLYVENGYVYTIEGNTGGSAGVVANGGKVWCKSYALGSSYIHGYGVLPYKTNSSAHKVDFSGANPTAGLWITESYKYLYADAACTTRAKYGDGVYCDIPIYTVFEVTGITDDGKALIANYDGVSGYVSFNTADADPVRQISATESSSGGNNSGGSSSGGNTSGQAPVVDSVNNPEFILGIDISEHQAGAGSYPDCVNFEKLKASGCEFVILRVHNGNRYDYAFEALYKNARAAGMKLGAYMYTYATTRAQAEAEAKMLINYFEANDMYFEYPIWYDVENQSQFNLSSYQATELCLGWCETLEAAGYYPGVYSGLQLFNNLSDDFKYDTWIAYVRSATETASQYSYNSKNFYADGYSMWQYSWSNYPGGSYYVYDGVYTSTAQTTKVTGLDLDVSYKDYDAITSYYGYNNRPATGGTHRETSGNVLYGKETDVTGYGIYNADLTDAYIADGIDYVTENQWFGLYYGEDTDAINTEVRNENDIYGTITYNLGDTYNLTKLGVHYLNLNESGIAPPEYIKAFASTDGANYTEIPVTFDVLGEGTAVWSEVTVSNVTASYLKFEFGLQSAFAMIDEIEAFGTSLTGNTGNDDNYIANPDGTKAIVYTKQDNANLWWIRASFKQVSGNIYEVIEVDNNAGSAKSLAVPENGFVLTVHVLCETSGMYSFVSNLTTGTRVNVTGVDLTKEASVCETVFTIVTEDDGDPTVDTSGPKALIFTQEDLAGAWWIRASFQQVEGSIYKVITVNNSFNEYGANAIGVPTNGFVLAVHDTCQTEGMYDFILNLTEGTYVDVTGANLSKAMSECETVFKIVDYNNSIDSNISTDGSKALLFTREDTGGAWWIRAAFQRVEGNIYEVVANNNIFNDYGAAALPVPEDGFVVAVHHECITEGMHNYIYSLEVGTQVIVTGVDLTQEVSECEVIFEIVGEDNGENNGNQGDQGNQDGNNPPSDDFVLGDINNNGSVDMTDYILAKRAYFGTYKLTEDEFKRGNVNFNEEMDMTDYILIKRVYFGTYSFE